MPIPLTYTWRSLWKRRLTTILTLGGIALVVYVFASVLMLAHGLEVALVETGSDDNAVVLRRSASTELVSQVERDAANIIRTLPEVAAGPDGRALLSGETYVIINLSRKGTNAMGNIAVRGVSPEGMRLRPQVALSAGRMFQFGSNEIIVGSSIAKNFQGSEIGRTLRFADGTWTIVGVFDARGTGFDSEIWGDVEQMMPAFGRPVYSSALFRLTDPGQFAAAKARIEQDPRMKQSEVKRERLYYTEQSELMSNFIRILGIVVTSIFSVGAVIGAAITMYAAVANRTVEIGTMRALGFRRRSILSAFLLESVLLSAIGGLAGIVLAALMGFIRISTVNFGSFTELAFGFVLSPGIVLNALVFALFMGIVGGFLPAVRAARMSILNALRSD